MASLSRCLVLLGAVCLVLGVDSVNTKDECKHGVVNGSVTFPVSSSSPLNSILWTKEKNKVVDWDEGDAINPYPPFVGRVDLNTTSGDLTISNLSKQDAGNYIFDNTKLNFCLKVHDPLAPPKIVQISDKEFECQTPDSYQNQLRPVSFSWTCSSSVYENCSTPKINFEKTDNLPPEITCTIDNGISSNSATFHLTPESHSTAGWIIAISILIPGLLLGGIIIFLLMHYGIIKKIHIKKKGKAPGTGEHQAVYKPAETQDAPVS